MEFLTSTQTLAFLGGFGPLELTVILIIALLIFGKRLPDVMRSMGRGVVEFKKGVRGIEDEIEGTSPTTSTPQASSTQATEGPKAVVPPRED